MNSINPDIIAGLALISGAFAAVLFLLFIAICVFMLIVQWKTFTKAGEKGWKCLIPVYSQYTQYKLFWKPRWFWVMFLLGLATSVTGMMLTEETMVLLSIVSIVAGIFGLVLSIIFCVKLARSFGYSGAFAVGLIFLPVIFLAIIAFSRNEYIGPGGEMETF